MFAYRCWRGKHIIQHRVIHLVLFYHFPHAFIDCGFVINRVSVELATIFSFLLTVPTGFWLNKNIAFTEPSNEKKEKAKQFGKYSLVALQGQFTDYLITKGLIIFIGMNATLACVISTITAQQQMQRINL